MKRTGRKPASKKIEESKQQKEENFAVMYPHLRKASKEWRALYQEISRKLQS
ncbi:hypothetical protein PP175_04535 [Aneurinibacillus sp. Ricciae_BoGa-3]|uniref:hypothetical protein n=1 Tax=Aneurinibacillus sp. Ricciae_BoGa-3 TaxID=3022697 RepID=UPI0023425563|nr:hypothetical protein [Aneurinibacillus sp. Ricciae_BoGa-3]WCK55260.1 hypothetical protein PP175_04535 [Aneurinibacillus sp. Ricciae_BoGa-3]